MEQSDPTHEAWEPSKSSGGFGAGLGLQIYYVAPFLVSSSAPKGGGHPWRVPGLIRKRGDTSDPGWIVPNLGWILNSVHDEWEHGCTVPSKSKHMDVRQDQRWNGSC